MALWVVVKVVARLEAGKVVAAAVKVVLTVVALAVAVRGVEVSGAEGLTETDVMSGGVLITTPMLVVRGVLCSCPSDKVTIA